jgi:hypothetical protein
MAFTLGGTLFVAGGQAGTQPSSVVYRIGSDGRATQAGSLPGPRSDAGVAVVGSSAWLIGGETTDPNHPLSSVVEVRVTAG